MHLHTSETSAICTPFQWINDKNTFFCYSLLLGQFQLKLFYCGKGRQTVASNVTLYPCERSRQNHLVWLTYPLQVLVKGSLGETSFVGTFFVVENFLIHEPKTKGFWDRNNQSHSKNDPIERKNFISVSSYCLSESSDADRVIFGQMWKILVLQSIYFL